MTNEKELVSRFYTEALTVIPNSEPATILKAILGEQFRSVNAKETKDKPTLIAQIAGFWKFMPDMKWEIQEMIQEGNKVVVRSRFCASPKGNFKGVDCDGSKSFNTMAIDIHTIENGQITEVYHCEEWETAIEQLRK